MQWQAGRCGRVAPGVCIRLYSKEFHDYVMPPFDPPGIQRLPLENLLLRVLSLREPMGMSATALLQRVRRWTDAVWEGCVGWLTLAALERAVRPHRPCSRRP